MRRAGFTFVEVIAVVTLLGLLAGATAWSLAGDARRAMHSEVIDRIRHADHMARLTAQRTGEPQLLRFDLNQQRIEQLSDREAHRGSGSHPYRMPAGYRIASIIMPDIPNAPGYMRRNAELRDIDAGDAEVPYSSDGRSASYAVHVISMRQRTAEMSNNDPQQSAWLMISGLTGQAVLQHDDPSIHELFGALTANRADVD